VVAKEAKEVAEAKASLEPKSSKAKAAKSEADSAEPETKAPDAAPAKSALLLLDDIDEFSNPEEKKDDQLRKKVAN